MKMKRVVSKRTGKVGYWCRTSDPATEKRRKMTFWFSESGAQDLHDLSEQNQAQDSGWFDVSAP